MYNTSSNTGIENIQVPTAGGIKFQKACQGNKMGPFAGQILLGINTTP